MVDDASGLLLVDAFNHTPALARSVQIATSQTQAPTPVPTPDNLANDLDRPNDLAVQRWAVIAPDGPAGDVLLAQIQPLIAARTADQGAPAKVYRVPPNMDADAAARWKRTIFNQSERHRRDLPRYQLILGDLDLVSHDLQVSQSVDGFVGRLAFDRPEHYAGYCDKLLAAERGPSPAPRAVFHAVRDGTAATELGRKGLIHPCIELARDLRARARDEFPAEPLETGTDDPTPDEFLAAARDPGVMLSLSHGLGAPRGGWKSPAAQRDSQGALSFGRDGGTLRASDLADTPCLPGGVWFMFACFGAGTPTTSKYRRWLEQLAAHGELPGGVDSVLASLPPSGSPPFIAAIPRTVLANPRGPLAFIGHVDLAWTYSFREIDLGRPVLQTGRFLDTLASMLTGDRVGVAFDALFRWFARVSVELGTLDAGDTVDPLRRARLWLLRQDLAGFMLLGDPAARIHTPPSKSTTIPEPLSPTHFFPGMTVLPATTPALPALPRLEAAFAELLNGTGDLPRLAASLGLPAAELQRLFHRYREAGRAALDS